VPVLFYNLQTNVITLVYLVLLGVKMWALIDALLRPAQAFVAADKLTKTAWLWILALTLAAHLLLSSLIFGLVGTVAAFVYILDVKPAVAALTRRR
jgi:hypothetical protein